MPFNQELGATVDGAFNLYTGEPGGTGFAQIDPTRPLRWTVNADMWVQLSGFCKWNATANAAVAAGEQRTFGGTGLAGTTAQPDGIRDFPGTSFFGPVVFSVFPNGTLYFRYQQAVTLTNAANGSWFSFDGCFYRK